MCYKKNDALALGKIPSSDRVETVFRNGCLCCGRRQVSMFFLVFLKCMGIVRLFEQLLLWESEAPLSLHDDRKLECGWTVEVSRMGVDWNGICNCHSCRALCVEIPYLVTLPVVGFSRCRLLSSLVRTPCAALMVLLLAQNLDFSFLWCQPV